jgi:hypothetical protein
VGAAGLEPTNLLIASPLEIVRSSVVEADSGRSYWSVGPATRGLVRFGVAIWSCVDNPLISLHVTATSTRSCNRYVALWIHPT